MALVRLLVLGLAVSFGGSAFADESMVADQKAVEEIVKNQVNSWNRGDAAAFSQHLRPDIIMTNTVGMVSVGPAAFEKQHRFILSHFYKNTHVTMAISHLRALSPSVIIVDLDTSLSGSTWLAPGALVRDGVMFSKLEEVVVKENGQWAVTSYHNVFVAADE